VKVSGVDAKREKDTSKRVLMTVKGISVIVANERAENPLRSDTNGPSLSNTFFNETQNPLCIELFSFLFRLLCF
jgi:hypothetical protein